MNSTLEKTIHSLDDLPAVAKEVLNFVRKNKVFLIYASMGAGKTTLIKELCRSLGSEDNFSSPTFSIVNEYQSPNGKIFHFDLYRLKTSNELFDLGIEEYLDSDNYCFFEWPDLVEDILETSYIKIEIIEKENIRYLRATKIDT